MKKEPPRQLSLTHMCLHPNTNQRKLNFLLRNGFKTINKSKKPIFQKRQSIQNYLVMHQSIPAAPSPLLPFPTGLTAGICLFFNMDGKFFGTGHSSCQMRGGGDESRGQIPRPQNTTKFVA